MKKALLITTALLFTLMLKAQTYTFVADGCVLQVLNNAVIDYTFNLTTLDLHRRTSSDFSLDDGVETFSARYVNTPFADFVAAYNFFTPLINDCRLTVDSLAASLETESIIYVKKCDDQGATEVVFYEQIVYVDSVKISNTPVDGNGDLYTVIGSVKDDCCLTTDNQQFIELEGGVLVIVANTYNSVSIAALSGTTTITIGGGDDIDMVYGDPNLTWSAKDCEFLDLQFNINNSGGGRVWITLIN